MADQYTPSTRHPPVRRTVTIDEVTTNGSDGSSYTALNNFEANEVTIVNDSDADIEVQRNGSGVGLIVPAGERYTFLYLQNANDLGVRRKDQTTTQVTVTYEARWA